MADQVFEKGCGTLYEPSICRASKNQHRILEREMTRCVDPTVSMKATFASPSVGNCVSAKPEKSDNKYTFSNRCDYMGPVSTVITVHSAESYDGSQRTHRRPISEDGIGGRPRELAIARRRPKRSAASIALTQSSVQTARRHRSMPLHHWLRMPLGDTAQFIGRFEIRSRFGRRLWLTFHTPSRRRTIPAPRLSRSNKPCTLSRAAE